MDNLTPECVNLPLKHGTVLILVLQTMYFFLIYFSFLVHAFNSTLQMSRPISGMLEDEGHSLIHSDMELNNTHVIQYQDKSKNGTILPCCIGVCYHNRCICCSSKPRIRTHEYRRIHDVQKSEENDQSNGKIYDALRKKSFLSLKIRRIKWAC